MDETIKESLAGFEGLWARVAGQGQNSRRGETPAPAFSEEEALRGFISAEQCAAAFDSALARMFQGGGRAALLSHAAGAKRRARRLAAEYFIRTGVTCAPAGGCSQVGGKLASLRDAMLRERRSAADYARAAVRTASPELAALYRSYAAEAETNARETRALLVDSFA